MLEGETPEDAPDRPADGIARFRQGSLILCPPIIFVRHRGGQVTSGDAAAQLRLAAPWEAVVMSSDLPRFGIVTSQTCDVIDQGGDQPWVQVAPVRDLGSDVKPKAYLIRLTNGALPEGNWFADLRMEVPVDKGAFTSLRPLDGFASEEDEVAFAMELGRRRDRAALHDHINNILYGEWSRKIANNKRKAERELADLYGVRLRVAEGLRSRPLAVQIHFFGRRSALSAESQSWIEAWWDKARKAAAEADPPLNLMLNQFHDGSAANLELYDQLIPLQWYVPSSSASPAPPPEGAADS